MRAIVTGDIGCYTLGALPPLSAMDTTVDMGASVSMAHGFELALADTEHRPIVAVIGDSTFAHSGLSSLISTVYNRGAGTVCVLDNRTTAMTGRQGNPFNGVTLQNRPSRELNIEAVVAALGVEDVRVVEGEGRGGGQEGVDGVPERSGGVASGPMTATFMLQFVMGASSALGGNILRDAFGVVALVAMMPLLSIQAVGFVYERRAKRTAAAPEQYGDFDIVELWEDAA